MQDGLIVTGCSDGLVRVFDSRTGQCIKYGKHILYTCIMYYLNIILYTCTCIKCHGMLCMVCAPQFSAWAHWVGGSHCTPWKNSSQCWIRLVSVLVHVYIIISCTL